MTTLHIANTQFEWELTHTSDLKNSFHAHPFHIQLQFLPFLYAPPEDAVLLFHRPEKSYFENLKHLRSRLPKPIYFDELDLRGITRIESWGASKSIATWAKEKNLYYDIPDLSLVKTIAAKSFAFKHLPNLPNAKALHNSCDLEQWLEVDFWPKLLKVNYGTAGRGHRIIQCKTALHYNESLQFCQPEWQSGKPIIGEPWLKRKYDFSTQWHLSESIDFIGSTLMKCNQYGTYRGSTLAKDVYFDFAIHKQMVMPLLKRILELGYFGILGIDGFTFEDGQHITEVNPRKTMGWVTLELSRYLNRSDLKIEFVQPSIAKQPLLPFQVEGQKPFKMQLDFMKSALVK